NGRMEASCSAMNWLAAASTSPAAGAWPLDGKTDTMNAPQARRRVKRDQREGVMSVLSSKCVEAILLSTYDMQRGGALHVYRNQAADPPGSTRQGRETGGQCAGASARRFVDPGHSASAGTQARGPVL